MSLPKFVRLNASFDPVRLEQDLQAAVKHFRAVSQEGPYHDGSWKGISLRSVNGDYGNAMALSSGTTQDTEVLELCPYFKEILHAFKFQTGVVRVLFLPPGKKIGEHTDKGFNWNVGMVRLHIPIVTHPDVIFEIGGERCQWKPGEFWFGDFNQPHWLHNQSDVVRVHLVIDCFVDDELLKYFPAEALAAINAGLEKPMFINRRAAELDAATLARYEGHVRLPKALSPVPLYGKLVAEKQRLTLQVHGFPVSFGFNPQGENRFRYLDREIYFPQGPDSSTLVFSCENPPVNADMPRWRSLSLGQQIYVPLQQGVVFGVMSLYRALARSKQWWRRVASTD